METNQILEIAMIIVLIASSFAIIALTVLLVKEIILKK